MSEEATTSERYFCGECLQPAPCEECEKSERLDVEASEDRERLIEQLASRRKRYIRVMEALAIVVAAGILLVGLTVSAGLGGGLLDWVVKGFAVVVLAVFWQVVPVVYRRHFSRRAEWVVGSS